MSDHLIREFGALLDSEGRLREPGYATAPVLRYDRSQIRAARWRIKEWDYYLVNDDHYAVALTVSDLGYSGLLSASVLDFARGTFKTTSEMLVAPMGRLRMPADSDTGDVRYQGRRTSACFAHTPAGRRLSFRMDNFDAEKDLEVEVLLDRPPRDSMVIATPWREDPHAFYYNRKVIGMRATGAFRVGDFVHEFVGDVGGGDAGGDNAAAGGGALGLLDWGRGVWTYDNTWYWAAAQGHVTDANGRDHVIGLNLGYGFGDTSAASENMVFVDGIAHKLGRVDFGIPTVDGGAGDGRGGGGGIGGRAGKGGPAYDYLAPWHMTDDAGRLDLTFSPQIDRTDFINLAVVRSDQHQVFGLLTGTIVLDDGSTLALDGLRGSAEHIHNRY